MPWPSALNTSGHLFPFGQGAAGHAACRWESEGWCSISRHAQRGQVVLEVAFAIPLMMMLLFAGVQLGRIFYTYHALQKALRGGAGLLSRSLITNYCDPTDLTFTDVRNFIVFGNLQGEGAPIVQGLTPDMIQIVAEREIVTGDTAGLVICPCGEDTDTCDASSSGRSPDFVVINLGSGYPLSVPFPYVNLGTISLRVSVRMPVTGG